MFNSNELSMLGLILDLFSVFDQLPKKHTCACSKRLLGSSKSPEDRVCVTRIPLPLCEVLIVT